MDDNIRTSELMNYDITSSNSNNYKSSETSSNPNSFPDLMENGIIVDYATLKFTSEIVEEKVKTEE